MTQAAQLLKLIQANDEIKKTSFIVDEMPLEFFDPEDSIEFHASRLLFLLKFCSIDKLDDNTVGIKGRTKLAKLDFFLRYPLYLEQALQQSEFSPEGFIIRLEEREKRSIETTMIRYKYGPWDHRYYDVFAYLIAKNIMRVEIQEGVDYFCITELGAKAVGLLLKQGGYREILNRCQIIKRTLAQYSGGWLKKFIYRSFPRIVGQPVGTIIEGVFYV